MMVVTDDGCAEATEESAPGRGEGTGASFIIAPSTSKPKPPTTSSHDVRRAGGARCQAGVIKACQGRRCQPRPHGGSHEFRLRDLPPRMRTERQKFSHRVSLSMTRGDSVRLMPTVRSLSTMGLGHFCESCDQPADVTSVSLL